MSKRQPYTPRLDQGQSPAATKEKEPLLIPSEDEPEDKAPEDESEDESLDDEPEDESPEDESEDKAPEDEPEDEAAVYVAAVTLVVGRDQSIPPGGAYPAVDAVETESLLSRGLIRRRE